MRPACLLLIFLLSFIHHANSSEWIDVSDMTNPRLLRNRYRHSASFDHAAEIPSYSGDGQLEDLPPEDSASFRDHQHDSIIDYVPKNPFPSTDACLDRSLADPNAPDDPEARERLRANALDCISDELRKYTNIGQKIEQTVNVGEEERVETAESVREEKAANVEEARKEESVERKAEKTANVVNEKIEKAANTRNEKTEKAANVVNEKIEKAPEARKEKISKAAKSNPASDRPGVRPEHLKKLEADSKMLHSCLAKNKQLTEDLVCYRNLKSLYTRHYAKIRTAINSMQHDNKMIEIHPYSAEFHILVQSMSRENCLATVDDLEAVITKLDRFLSHIEPIDWSKHLIYGGIGISIVFCLFYIYRYMKFKYLVITLLLFIVWAHEYYHLLLAKKAEISHTLRKYERCQESGVFVSVWSFLFKGFQSTVSFKADECDLMNEHYLYIDAVFKINPLEPAFTVLPKLFSKSLIIVLENSAIAFSKFCAQLPLFHAYPILILFLALLLSLVYLLICWHVKLRTVEHDREIRIRQLENGSKHPMIGGGSAAALGAPKRKSISSGPSNRMDGDRLDGDRLDGDRLDGDRLDGDRLNDDRLDDGQALSGSDSNRVEDERKDDNDNRKVESSDRRTEDDARAKDVRRTKDSQRSEDDRRSDGIRGSESSRTDDDRRTEANCSVLDRSSRFDRLQHIRATPNRKDDSLTRVLRRTKSLDFIPVF